MYSAKERGPVLLDLLPREAAGPGIAELSLPSGKLFRRPSSEDSELIYRLTFEDERPKGMAKVLLRRLDEFQGAASYEGLQRVGIGAADLIADLDEFYPNGRRYDEESGRHMRCGVGSCLMKQILADVLARGATVMRAYTSTESMRRFLSRRFDFAPLPVPANTKVYYRFLTPRPLAPVDPAGLSAAS